MDKLTDAEELSLLRNHAGWDNQESYSLVPVLSFEFDAKLTPLPFLQRATEAKLVLVTKGDCLELIEEQVLNV